MLKKKKALSHFGNFTGDWVKKREETIPSLSMPPRPRNSKGANMPPAASEPMGENEVAFRQKGEVPLTEQEVVSEQRNTRKEPDPVARMTAMLKDLQQEVHLLKEGKTQEVRNNAPPMGNQDKTELEGGSTVGVGGGNQPPVPNTGERQCPLGARKGKTLGDPQAIFTGSPIPIRTPW